MKHAVETLLPVGLAARAIGISENYVRLLCDNGTLKSTRDASGRQLIPTEVVREFAERRRMEKPEPAAMNE
jgi:hypothetical protein